MNTEIQSEERVNTEIMRLLLNLSVRGEGEQRETEVSAQPVFTPPVRGVGEHRDPIRGEGEHQDPIRGEGEHRDPVQADPLYLVYERQPRNSKYWREF